MAALVFEFSPEADWYWQLNFFNPDGSNLNLTGRSFECPVTPVNSDTPLLTLKTSDATITLTTNTLQFYIADDLAVSWPHGDYTIDIIEIISTVRIPFLDVRARFVTPARLSRTVTNHGDVTWEANRQEIVASASIAGPPGPAGPTGATGSTGATGAAGTVWRSGSGAPSNALGVNGDYYLNTTTGSGKGDVYQKASGTYSIVGNIKGADGAGAGDVVGPASSVNNEIALFSGTTGKLIKSAGATLAAVATSGSAADLSTGTLAAARMPALTGDVTTSAGAVATTIANSVVTFAKLATAAVGTAAEILSNTASKLVSVAALWSAQAFTTLTDAATIAVDLNTGVNFKVTLGGNRTLGAPTNAKEGQSGVIQVIQDGTGSRTLAYNAAWSFGNAGAPTLSTTAGKIDLISYVVLSTSGPVIRASFLKDS